MSKTSKPVDEQIERILRFNCPSSCDGNGTYAEDDGHGNPEPTQCQWCFEFGMPAREAIAQAEKEARIDELETTGIDMLLAHTVGEQHKVRDDRLAQLRGEDG